MVVVARAKVGGLRVSMCVRKRGFQGGLDILGLRRNVMVARGQQRKAAIYNVRG